MTTVAVTGADGFLGWHLRCLLRTLPDYVTVPIDRASFGNPHVLQEIVSRADAVIHLAGVNRGSEMDVELANERLAKELVAALEGTGTAPHIVYANSIQSRGDTPYGRSKRRAAEILNAWAARAGARFTDLVLPHLYGEHGRPFYNSVVATFCHQVAAGERPAVDPSGRVELLHVQDVAALITAVIRSGESGQLTASGQKMTVPDLLARVDQLRSAYSGVRVPDLRDPQDLRLFNTLRSFLYPKYYPVPIEVHSDRRGDLVEAVKSDNGGQTFLSTTRPGMTRGDHFHLRKVERFLVLDGEALIRLRRLFSEEVVEFRLSGDRPAFVDMPTMHVHNITNVGATNLVTVFWTNEVYDPADADTFAEAV